jgi:nucleoside-diphosphate-sugar epimerase
MSKTILLLGATSGIGLWTAYNLLKTNHRVIVICRNEEKLATLFKEDAKKFHKVIKMDIEASVEKYEKDGGENPFESHLEGVDILINCVGASKTRNVNHSRIIDLETNKLLISAAKNQNIQKFILVTSMYITRPNEFVSFILNTMVGNCLSHKLEAENTLRESGLNYTIVRPGGLKGNKEQTLDLENTLPVEQPVIK